MRIRWHWDGEVVRVESKELNYSLASTFKCQVDGLKRCHKYVYVPEATG